MQQLGCEAWWHPWLTNPAQWMSEHGRRFDTVIVSRHYIASAFLPLLRQFAPRAQILFDTVDLHYLREQREAELSGDAAQARAAAITRERELRLEIGRAHVRTPVTNAHLVCRLLLEKKKTTTHRRKTQ